MSIRILLFSFIYCLALASKAQDADSIAFRKINWETQNIGNGLLWQSYHCADSSIFNSKQNINILRLKKGNESVSLAIGRADEGALTSTIAYKHKALAAVNASFFNTKTLKSVNFIKIAGAITDTSVTNGTRYSSHQMGIFAFDKSGVDILMRDTTFGTNWDHSIAYENAIESGPILILDGSTSPLSNTPFNTNRHPRTCVGISPTEVIILTVDGRSNQSYGLTLFEVQKVMRWLGCEKALNFDGGGSTTMYIRGKSCTGVVNMPSDNKKFDHEGERKVSNALMILRQM